MHYTVFYYILLKSVLTTAALLKHNMKVLLLSSGMHFINSKSESNVSRYGVFCDFFGFSLPVDVYCQTGIRTFIVCFVFKMIPHAAVLSAATNSLSHVLESKHVLFFVGVIGSSKVLLCLLIITTTHTKGVCLDGRSRLQKDWVAFETLLMWLVLQTVKTASILVHERSIR